MNEIRSDLETIMNAHLDITDDKVAELLQFFNKSVNSILTGASCDPRTIDKILQDRFHMTVIILHLTSTFLLNLLAFSRLYFLFIL